MALQIAFDFINFSFDRYLNNCLHPPVLTILVLFLTFSSIDSFILFFK